MAKAKKIVLWALLAFFIYAVFTNPDRAAGIIENIWGLIVDGFNAIIRFFDSLLNRT